LILRDPVDGGPKWIRHGHATPTSTGDNDGLNAHAWREERPRHRSVAARTSGRFASGGSAGRGRIGFVKTILNRPIVLTKRMIRGDAATRLLLDLESSKRNVFLTGDAAKALGIPKSAVNGLLHRLVKKGRIYRVERGKHALVPAEAGIAGVWTELPEVIGWRLAEPSYVGFAAALFYWDMTEQKPGVTHVVTTKRKRPLKYKCYEF